MKNVIILSFGELWLKGENREHFIRQLLGNTKKAIEEFNATIKRTDGSVLVCGYNPDDEQDILRNLSLVFGYSKIVKAIEVDADEKKILDAVVKQLADISKPITFKVQTKRTDKTFPKTSPELNGIVGHKVLTTYSHFTVEIHNPELVVGVSIKQNKKAYISFGEEEAACGLPVGVSGAGLSLLSGGIDSPVASHQMAKRGLEIVYINFESFPYTSLQAKQKVLDLAKILKPATLSKILIYCNIKEIQETLNKNTDKKYAVVLTRVLMARICDEIVRNPKLLEERISNKKLLPKNKLSMLITGESLGQVASQTIENLTVVNNAIETIFIRPLIARDKEEIIKIAKKIGTFETSIKPYEDSCTVFAPQHPITKAKQKDVDAELSRIDAETLIKKALSTLEIVEI